MNLYILSVVANAMKFDKGIEKKYRKSVEDAFDTILAHGTSLQKEIATHIVKSKMLVQVKPVSEINASGITGLIDPDETNERIADGRLGLREALGEVYIAIAEETIDTGGQRGCEGTFVHEGRHAYDFARTIESFSNADVNPLSLFDPTLYELELEAHKISGDYMLCINKDEYHRRRPRPDDPRPQRRRQPLFCQRRRHPSPPMRKLRPYAGRQPGPCASELLGLRQK